MGGRGHCWYQSPAPHGVQAEGGKSTRVTTGHSNCQLKHAQLEIASFFGQMSTAAQETAPQLVPRDRLLQGGRKGSQGWHSLLEGAVQSEHQRLGIKLRNLASYVWEDTRPGSLNYLFTCT